ncbi:auxilin-like protein 1 [Melia azedarach]|uniref:Auxilin-like protein 1 n=1 Tax=Melia azedarach TaxID=155640 RepID=A0ACC1WVL7_MELAZ|nr:auxilin-like protein 1 [Melia azedarach]
MTYFLLKKLQVEHPGKKNRATVMDCKREEMNDLKAEKWGGILTKLVQSVNDLELKERFFTMKIFENPEENGKKLQVFEEAHKQEEAERKCNAAQTACQLKEDVYEPKLDQGVHDQEQYGKKASVSGLQEEKEVTFDTSPKVEAREKKQRRLWDLTGGNLVLQLRDNEHTKIKILQEEQVWLENENKGKEVLEEKESDTRSKDFPETEEHEFTLEENFDPEENGKRDEATYEKVEFEDQQKESCRSKESEGGLGDVHDREDAENASDKAEEQENVGVTINGFHDREQGGEKLGEDVELGAKGELMEAEENDQRLEESHEWEETEKVHRQIDHRKEDEKMKVTQEACEHFRNDPEVANDIYIEDKTDSLNETPVASVHRENDEYHEVPTYEDNEGLVEVSQASSECKERETESNVVDLANDQEEKGILEVEIAGLAQVVLELHSEIQKQVKDTAKAQASEHKGLNIGVSDMDVWKKSSDQYEKEPSTFNDAGNFVEELTSESEENFEDVEEVEAAMKQGEDESNSERSREERWIDNGENVDATQVSSMFQGKGESTETSQSTEHGKDNHSETLKTVGMEAEGTMQKEVGLQKGCESKLDEVKEKEREREKERIAVERAIREARERAFTEARERAERAAVANAEARRRAMAEAQETLGRAAAEVNDKLAAERTSMEARLKAERAAVERATAEARERALEKAMSKKATSQSRNQAVKSSGSSSENGIRHSSASNDLQYKGSGSSRSFGYSNSSSRDVPHSTVKSDGVNGESAERVKARLESHQRIAERAAKALAEKNMRDQLARREQAERNRLAGVLDGEVKRWSSGKTGNLRALLSTLQYILGPDSGWQPIPLTDLIATAAVKKSYRKATLCVHPDKLQQRGASIQQKYTCEKVFDLLKEAWNKFNAEER